MKRKTKRKTAAVISLFALASALTSCNSGSNGSGEDSSVDGKTYSFVVSYFDDAGAQVGYDYVPYGKPSRSVRQLDNQPSYDYKPHSEFIAKAGKRMVFDSWVGQYQNVDTSLPPYSSSHPAPENGEEVSVNNIKGECSLKSVFIEEDIVYTTRFYSDGSIIKDGDVVYDDGVKHEWGSFPSLPATPSKGSSYGYKTDFLGYGFKSDGKSAKPFSSFDDAGFYYGFGEPNAVSSFVSSDGTAVSELPSGSLYEDISTKDESGYYTLDLYGYDGEWTKVGSMATLNPKINLYANFASPSKVDFDVNIYSSYKSYVDGDEPLATTSATFASSISFSEDFLSLSFKQNEESVDETIGIDASNLTFKNKNIRKWMGKFSSDEGVSELYRGKLMPDDAYVLAPLSLFPISSDCSIAVKNNDGEVLTTLYVKYGSKITVNETDKKISATDSAGNEVTFSYASLGEVDWELTYSEDDIALAEEFKGKAVSIEDAIIGDGVLTPSK